MPMILDNWISGSDDRCNFSCGDGIAAAWVLLPLLSSIRCKKYNTPYRFHLNLTITSE